MQIIRFVLFFSLFFLLVVPTNVTSQSVTPDSKSYTTQADFNGTYTNTVWNAGRNGVNLAGTNASGSYTSSVFNAGDVVDWQSITMSTDQPAGTQLPDNNAVADGVDMTGNLALYHFNETAGATTFADSSGNNNTLTCNTVTRCPTMISGLYGNTADFPDRDDTYLNSSSLSVKGLSSFTISFWLRTTRTDRNRMVYTESVNGTANRSRVEVLLRNGALQVVTRTNDNSNTITMDVRSNITLTTNQWNHFLFTYNANTGIQRMYTNGAVETFNVAALPFPNTSPTIWGRIGQQVDGTGGRIEGDLDEFSIFNRELSSSEIQNITSAGAGGKITMQARGCTNVNCTGNSVIGPGGTSSTGDVYNLNGLSSTNLLPQTVFPDTQYFQYIVYFSRNALFANTVNPTLTSVVINFNRTATPTLAFSIRTEDGTSNTNICDFGEASTSATVFCRYRLWINTNANAGYSVFIRVDGNLRSGAFAITNAATASSGGTDISNATAGTERYGILVSPGSATGGTPVVSANFSAGTNAAALTNTTNLLLVSLNGPNVPVNTSTTQTILMEHRLNISGSTPPGTYAQRVTFSVVPNF